MRGHTDTDTDREVPLADAARGRLSRRRVLGLAGAGAIGAAVAGAGGVALGRSSASGSGSGPEEDVVPFHGRHQAGIATPVQDRLHFAAFDVTATSRADLEHLLRAWTTAAARMTQGLGAGTFGPVDGPYQAPPDDTGEALGLRPARLTLTFGLGRSLFIGPDGEDRFGLGRRLPPGLIELPHFPGDNLDPARTGGDLCVQACADDPQVAVHAIRNLARIGFGAVGVRWSQLGFGRTSSTSTAQATPRNLFGFKDGTANLKVEQGDLLDRHVWVGGGGDQASRWMAGGSYLVARRIKMHIETWDRTPLAEQEALIGRDKGEGAPLSGGVEHTAPDFSRRGAGGHPLIPLDSHVRLAHPDLNDGVQLLRRGYNFTDGSDGLGRLDAGLFFIAFVRDPRTHYVPMQTTLARDDALSEYLQHTGSGLFAVPPGVADPAGFVGHGLFEA
jgi:deferrochelatase/peroxidase EfeB